MSREERNAMDDVFDGFDDAQVGAGGIYFDDGTYLVEVLEVFAKQSRKKENLFIVEAKILESDCAKRKPGTKASWVVNLKHDASLGNIKGFLSAATGEAAENLTKQDLKDSMSKEQPLAGTKVRLQTVTIQTQAKKDFTKHNWSAYEE